MYDTLTTEILDKYFNQGFYWGVLSASIVWTAFVCYTNRKLAAKVSATAVGVLLITLILLVLTIVHAFAPGLFFLILAASVAMIVVTFIDVYTV